MHRVIILDDVAQEGLDLLEAADGIEYEIHTGLKGDELRQALAEADGAVCRSGVKITAEAMEGNRRLKAIVRAGVGTDNIDKVAATRHGIVVMNTPAGNTLSTAEHTFALMLGLSRNIAAAHQSLQAGRWDRKQYMGTQLADKTLGIIGLGRIGQEVAQNGREHGLIAVEPAIHRYVGDNSDVLLAGCVLHQRHAVVQQLLHTDVGWREIDAAGLAAGPLQKIMQQGQCPL
mgnify:CR=1 FL=1